MSYTKVKVPSPMTGELVEGLDIPIVESTERWTELRLEDGTVMRAKLNVTQVVRLSERDAQGNPVFNVNAQPGIMIVNFGNAGEES